MSPAKPAKKSNTLTIHFSGICTFVWDRKRGTAEVRMVDLASAGFQQHYAALGIAVTEDMPRGILGPDADAAVSLPNVNIDMGLWNLIGSDVTIVGATGKLTVDDAKVDGSKKPAKTAESIRWLPNLRELTESDRTNALCPISATVQIPAGRITANARVGASKVEFLDGGTPIGPNRYYVPRLTATIPFDREIALVLDRRRIIRFIASMEVVISNTCVCAFGMPGMPNHFYAHYDVVDARRRPIVQRAGPQMRMPSWPEWCYMAFVEI
jgi:hypothetical protein